MFKPCQHAVPSQMQSGFILDWSLQTCSSDCQTHTVTLWDDEYVNLAGVVSSLHLPPTQQASTKENFL